MVISNWLKLKLHRYFNLQCPLCGLNIEEPTPETRWCKHCLNSMSDPCRCQCCGLSTLEPVEFCGECLSNPPPWRRLYCVNDYRPPLSHYIHSLKFQHQFRLAPDLSYLLAQKITEPADVITSVPLHWRRELIRGYNQSDHLARALCQHFNMPERFNPNLFKRVKYTAPQLGQDKKARHRNLYGAFRLIAPPAAKHVAIVDDVVTTGSTIRQMCNLLLDVGVETIDIYCICRTPEPK
ncbi:putative amidophosphoribosyltransferase [Vibrio nigripulchritudo SFn27]|uniref:Putative amidophosphoribosyltransferase n=1 Tax=Vibrio nigripulchritudo TaxID=28173 RepID=U4KHA0_9VIBR|nr:ComF family protein [Vibrio nigripulchritudo]CCN85635.1 putative amidophosphoribosyltransferase [Vibrio nigripulchritudo BLFn1]CCN91047.1 putative amidophosphoribosyltransferase [Vibrio nigripulchritudo SFn27]CCN93579.1 putative amidophosphoribosyltransferase [Vibrio nigripulchritudo ENn2]CCO40054.1 putative amidophosphoribosyltransferase [Vibrio nigripulchritudo SFn135]CCO54126.1 putative amidophosphoribosyltransferase [Vibrio nigripulchritudo Wn13]